MTEVSLDGRVARRLRSGEAVIDALLALTSESGHVPSAADIAARAEVSLRSVYLHMADTTFTSRLIERSAAKDVDLFAVSDLGDGPLSLRISRLVAVRVNAVNASTRLIRASVALFETYPSIRDNYDHQRRLLRGQTRSQFAVELDRLDSNAAEHLLDAIDGLTQVETIRYYLEIIKRSPVETIDMLASAIELLLANAGSRT